ncbi:hypothetical protein [Senegalia massiliensis]|uniref:hypothetical protein n=1 Tax=Senegalia massiliensis TaxID=1720316 RepID=UPI0013620F75|nr:hypothetical protein [Senegalia massiliensis]
MKNGEKEQGKISLIISAIISLIVGVFNISSRRYFNGIFMLIVCILTSIELFRRYKK